MRSEPLTLYDLWDITIPPTPAVSQLYHLAPIGLGTSDSESLTSYVVRLAQAHRVSVRALVVAEIRPQLGPAAARATYLKRLPMFWQRDVATVNGTSGTALAWVRALQVLTQRTDLMGLTMLRWAEVLAAVGLVRTTRMWCSSCYHDQQHGNGIIYDLLLWALGPVTWCVRHGRRLEDRCPGCSTTQPVLAPHARPGYCARCGCWLGAPPTTTAPNHAPPHPWDCWLTHAVGSLVAAASAVERSPQRAQIVQVVQALMDRMPWGHGAPLARLMHLTDSVVAAWRHGQQVPQLENLVRLSACLGRLPTEMLDETDIAGMVHRTFLAECLAPPQRTRPSYRRRDWDAIQTALEAVVAEEEEPPPALCTVGQRLAVAVSQLRVRFPVACRVISGRYQAYCRVQSQQRQANLVATIRHAVLQIHDSGRYPNLRRVAGVLPKPGLMRAPEARAAWRTMLVELGWREPQLDPSSPKDGQLEA